jgi:CelD/BcsL family acetyltransferase involved in cellulose biosynthesis
MVDLAQGDTAWALLRDDGFLDQWRRLAGECAWSTACQGSDFVSTWYDVYREDFSPVIVSMRSTESRLIGLMTMAISKDGSHLVMAGAHQAEYHGWLATEETERRFPSEALHILRKRFPRRQLTLRYLTPDIPLDGLREDPFWQSRIVWKSSQRPLMRLGDGEDCLASLRKKSNKSRWNRLKAQGELSFQELTTAAELDAVLDEIIAMYDGRQQAVNGVAPFASDPHKRPFHVAMMEHPNLLHATTLTLNGRVVAAHLGLRSGPTVHLAIVTHAEEHDRHSPGKLHLLKLGHHLATSGVETLDLTPGGDRWKDRFANDFDQVQEARIFFSGLEARSFRANRLLRQAAKRVLHGLRGGRSSGAAGPTGS